MNRKIFGFDLRILHTWDDNFSVRTFEQGLMWKNSINELRRKDKCQILIRGIPPFKSVKEKNLFFKDNFDSLRLDLGLFMKRYITTYMPEFLGDSVLITDMKYDINDPITKFSLESIKANLELIEILFNANKYENSGEIPVREQGEN